MSGERPTAKKKRRIAGAGIVYHDPAPSQPAPTDSSSPSSESAPGATGAGGRRPSSGKKRRVAGGGLFPTPHLSEVTDLAPDASDEQRSTLSGSVVTRSVASRVVNPRVKTILRDLFGTRKDGKVDTATAAERLGVSRRAVQRWMKGESKGSKKLAELKAAWQDSPKGRQRRVDPGLKKKLQGTGAVWVTASVEASKDRRNGRVRRFEVSFNEQQGKALYEAVLRGDKDAHEAMSTIAAGGFGGNPSFHFVDVDFNGKSQS